MNVIFSIVVAGEGWREIFRTGSNGSLLLWLSIRIIASTSVFVIVGLLGLGRLRELEEFFKDGIQFAIKYLGRKEWVPERKCGLEI